MSNVTGLRIRLPSETGNTHRAQTLRPVPFRPDPDAQAGELLWRWRSCLRYSPGKDISSPVYDGVTYESGSYGDGPAASSTARRCSSTFPESLGLSRCT